MSRPSEGEWIDLTENGDAPFVSSFIEMMMWRQDHFDDGSSALLVRIQGDNDDGAAPYAYKNVSQEKFEDALDIIYADQSRTLGSWFNNTIKSHHECVKP